jgi:hypothetical protein
MVRFVWKTLGNRSLKKPRYRQGILFKMVLLGWDEVDWIDLASDRDKWHDAAKTVIKLRLPQNVGNSLISGEPVGLSWPDS